MRASVIASKRRFQLSTQSLNTYLVGVLFEIEFFQRTKDHPGGETLRRNSGQFANERNAETYGITRRPKEADGFRLWKDGALLTTVSIGSRPNDVFALASLQQACQQSHSNKLGKACSVHFRHDVSAIDLDCSRTDAQIERNDLVGLAGDKSLQDIALAS